MPKYRLTDPQWREERWYLRIWRRYWLLSRLGESYKSIRKRLQLLTSTTRQMISKGSTFNNNCRTLPRSRRPSKLQLTAAPSPVKIHGSLSVRLIFYSDIWSRIKSYKRQDEVEGHGRLRPEGTRNIKEEECQRIASQINNAEMKDDIWGHQKGTDTPPVWRKAIRP